MANFLAVNKGHRSFRSGTGDKHGALIVHELSEEVDGNVAASHRLRDSIGIAMFEFLLSVIPPATPTPSTYIQPS